MAIIPDLEVERAKTADLIPYAGNAKEHPEWQVEQIANSIDQFGMDDPIAVWTNPDGGLEIVEGHGRLLACKKLGIKEVPIIRLDHLDDDARRAYTLVHNQLTLNTGFDADTLAAEMKALPDFEWDDLGFSVREQLEDFEHVEEDELPEQAPTRVSPGDVWACGEHRLMCGDSVDAEQVSFLMGGEKTALLLTDPPYGVAYRGGEERQGCYTKRRHRRERVV